MLKIPTGGGKPVVYLQSVALDLKTGATEKQIQVVRAGLEPGTSGLQIQALTTRPRRLPIYRRDM